MRPSLALLLALLVACGPGDGDGDGDGHLAPMDCDDADPAVSPTAGETCDNGVDDDCDGAAYGCGPAGIVHLSEAEVRVLGSERERPGNTAWVIADFDGDAVADAALTNWTGGVRRLHGPLVGESSLDAGDLLFGQSATVGLAAGDLDGDGRAELAVGAPVDAETDVVYILDGGTPDGSGAEAAVGAIEVPGEARLAVLPDTTGDGVADLVASAMGDEEDAAGAVWVLWRVDDGPRAADDAGVRLSGSDPGDLAVVSLAGGDIDGDGLSDVVIGAPYTGDVGRVFVEMGPLLFDAALEDADAYLYGRVAGARFGESVASGDVDGDGLADVVVGDRTENAAWVFSAPRAPAGTEDATARIEGPEDAYTFGYRVSVPGDVTGDGQDDVLVGQPYGCWLYGCAWLWSGPIAGVASTDDATALLVGESVGSDAGLAIGGAGDVDEDGVDDLFVTAPDTVVADRSVGAAYLVFGGPGF